MREYVVERALSEEQTAALRSTYLGDGAVDFVLPTDEPAVVRRGDTGEILLKWLPDVLDAAICRRAWESLRKVRRPIMNRHTATGNDSTRPVPKLDGTISKTVQVAQRFRPDLRDTHNDLVGSMERSSPRRPICRLTSFTRDRPAEVERAIPFFQAVDRVFAAEMPDRYAAQLAYVGRTHPAWVIPGTAFTTVTVNRNFRTAVHTDRGDLAEGFGVMAVLRAGTYRGGVFVVPAYRVGVDMQTRGVLLADVHEWHGNTEIVGIPGRYERISTVLYYRAKMHRCKSPEAELELGKRRRQGDPIWPEYGEHDDDFDPAADVD